MKKKKMENDEMSSNKKYFYFKDILTKNSIVTSLTLFAISLLMGSITFTILEEWNYLQGLYFTAETLSTVGYGGFTPTKEYTRVFFIFWCITSLFILAHLTSSIARKTKI